MARERHLALRAARHTSAQAGTLFELFLFLFPPLAEALKFSVVCHSRHPNTRSRPEFNLPEDKRRIQTETPPGYAR